MKYLDKNTEVKLSIKDAIGVGFVLASLMTMYFTLRVEIAEAKELPPPIMTAEEFRYKDEIVTKTIMLTQKDVDVIKEDVKEIKETEAKLRKQIAQLRMARYTLIGMGVFTAAMFFMPTEKINALSDISNLLYISGAGIVGTYMGTSAWMARK